MFFEGIEILEEFAYLRSQEGGAVDLDILPVAVLTQQYVQAQHI